MTGAVEIPVDVVAAAPTPATGPGTVGRRPVRQVMLSSFGWGGGMAVVRMACSFISIKITAVALGPAGLAVIAQFSSFVSLFQSALGQGLMTGVVRLDAECGEDAARRRRIRSTAARMLVAFAAAFGVAMLLLAPRASAWLLSSPLHAGLMAASGLAVAAAMVNDLLSGTLSASKEVGLIGRATMIGTVLGLAIYAPCAWAFGVAGGLWGTFAVLLVTAVVSAVVVARRSRGVRLADFTGPFDRAESRRLLRFYPMLLVNGALAPLTLILVRDALGSRLGLEAAGLWQATWRLSEAWQAIIVSSTALFFMASMGERAGDPVALRHQLLRTLATSTGVTAAIALVVVLLREVVVHVVFSARFAPVAALMPMQLAGDVLKMAGWILAMSLVAVMRTRAFITLTVLSTASFAGLTWWLAGPLGIRGALVAYLATGVLQVAGGAWALRDVLGARPRREEAR